MTNIKLMRILFKLCALVGFLPIFFLALLFSNFLQNVLKKALKELGPEEVNRLLADKGLFAIFDFLEHIK